MVETRVNRRHGPNERITCQFSGSSSSSFSCWPSLATLAGDASLGSRSDGNRKRRLVRLRRGWVGEADWSPDGGSIAFTNGGNVYVVRADGSGRRRLATGGVATGRPTGGESRSFAVGTSGSSTLLVAGSSYAGRRDTGPPAT